MDDILDEINNLIEDQERDLKFRLGDGIYPINFDTTPTIAYDYLNIDDDLDFSFHHDEFNKSLSEQYPGKSDYCIYFDKIKNLCKKSLEESLNNSHHTQHLKTINPNNKILDIVKKIFKLDKLYPEQLPQFGEFGLYTNINSNRAPRVFFFIGAAGMIYILFYDPFHLIFPKK
jgi:hypothetical protein